MRARTTLGFSLSLTIALVAGGCSGMTYEGEVAPATAHLDVYFDDGAIEQAYTTMGSLSVGNAASIKSLETDLARAGMKRGADAIIIDGLSQSDSRSVSSSYAEGSGRPRYIADLATGGVRNVGGVEHHERLGPPSGAAMSARLVRYDR